MLDTCTVADRWKMWRVFPSWNTTAHGPSGKVRVEGENNGKILFQVSFDGINTYNQNGIVSGAQANAEWSEAFGFGIIRFALDEGFGLTRLAGDEVEGHPAYNLAVRDPSGSDTLFWIDSDSFVIRKVGFDTPRGWHERIYSGFEYHENPRFQQPTRVRLYYNGALTNDVLWEHYAINAPIADEVFVLGTAAGEGGDEVPGQDAGECVRSNRPRWAGRASTRLASRSPADRRTPRSVRSARRLPAPCSNGSTFSSTAVGWPCSVACFSRPATRPPACSPLWRRSAPAGWCDRWVP